MSKIPQEIENKTSEDFRLRLIELIDDEECKKNDFAVRVGVSKDVINRAVIYGIVPSLKSLIKIADYLNISLEYLLCQSDIQAFDKSDTPTTFQVRLKQLREEKQVTYSKIANTMPFSKNFFYEWLKHNTLPSYDYLSALAKYFGVSVDYLLGRTDNPSN